METIGIARLISSPQPSPQRGEGERIRLLTPPLREERERIGSIAESWTEIPTESRTAGGTRGRARSVPEAIHYWSESTVPVRRTQEFATSTTVSEDPDQTWGGIRTRTQTWALGARPGATSRARPRARPRATLGATLGATPGARPRATTGASPRARPRASLGARPGASLGAMPGASRGAREGASPWATPWAAPGLAPRALF
jgi:hypothetical protein